LKNISARSIVFYALDEGGGSIAFGRVVGNFHDRPVIAPGESKQEMVGLNLSGRITPDGLAEDSIPRRIVVAAAVFSDGSHEGDDIFAVRLKSGQIGYRTQYRRIKPFIDRIIRDSAPDDDGRVVRIREELHSLSNRPDDSTIRAVRSQFPDLPNEVVVKDLTDALDSARQKIWGEVYGYVHSSGTYPPPSHPPPLAEWWRATRQAIDPMLLSPE